MSDLGGDGYKTVAGRLKIHKEAVVLHIYTEKMDFESGPTVAATVPVEGFPVGFLCWNARVGERGWTMLLTMAWLLQKIMAS